MWHITWHLIKIAIPLGNSLHQNVVCERNLCYLTSFLYAWVIVSLYVVYPCADWTMQSAGRQKAHCLWQCTRKGVGLFDGWSREISQRY